jgi:hypothetical protein
MKLLSFMVTLALLAIVMLADSSPPTQKTKQNVAASTSVVQPMVAEVRADATALVSNNEKMIGIANSDNEVVGANNIDGKNEVAARARNGSFTSTLGMNIYKSNMRVETDIGNILLL